jgi:homoserine kinase
MKVTVPASTANLGPGFDCLGLALDLHNTVEMTALESGLEVAIEGEGAAWLPRDGNNLVAKAAIHLWQQAGRQPTGFSLKITNQIPPGMGLGSSAAAIVGGLVAANVIIGEPFSRSEILRLAYRLEGHADNAAAALYGGLVVVSADGDEVLIDTIDVPPLRIALALPDVQLSTRAARAVLPAHVPLGDAAFNIGRALFVARALQSGDYERLGRVMVDRLHEPYRRPLIPGFDAAKQAARKAGAAAVALSGAGPSIAAFAPGGHAQIAKAMKAAFEANGVKCRTLVLAADRRGTLISKR